MRTFFGSSQRQRTLSATGQSSLYEIYIYSSRKDFAGLAAENQAKLSSF